ncbi:FecR family protein [Delftia sp. WSY_7]|uniref:FecR family protein n=1 Tax=Delftia sp. WSY_7 TaxID=3367202 RepID=UPI00370B2A5F
MSTPREEAARWFIRMHRDAGARPGAADAAAWRRWMDADPRHAAEYAAFEALWQDFDSTPRTEALATAVDTAARQRRNTRSNTRRAIITRGVLGVAGLGTAGLLAWRGWLEWQDTTVFALARDSAIGERIVLNLPDASVLTLGPASRIATRYTRRQRAVVLERGEALFDVARDADRHFTIDAGQARITVLGTRFTVNRLPGLVRVGVEHGTVRLAVKGAEGEPFLLLQAGEVGELPDESAGAAPGADGDHASPRPRRVQRDARDSFSSIERGLIVFDSAGLGEIAATLSRWRRQPVRAAVADGTGGQRITAAVQRADVENFLDALPRIAAVRVQERDGATWLAPRSTAPEKIRKN